jgi:hypothetical protein
MRATQISNAGLAAVLGMALSTTALAADEAIAVAQSADGAHVLLYTQSGPCTGQARLAQHVAPDGEKTPGCWVMSESMVLISFLDGERGNIPLTHLRRLARL